MVCIAVHVNRPILTGHSLASWSTWPNQARSMTECWTRSQTSQRLRLFRITICVSTRHLLLAAKCSTFRSKICSKINPRRSWIWRGKSSKLPCCPRCPFKSTQKSFVCSTTLNSKSFKQCLANRSCCAGSTITCLVVKSLLSLSHPEAPNAVSRTLAAILP